jgi:hypothetical protein
MLEAETVCRNGAETQQKEEGNIFSVLSGKFHHLRLKVQVSLSTLSFLVSPSKSSRSKGCECLVKAYYRVLQLHRLVLEFIASFLTAKQPLPFYMTIRHIHFLVNLGKLKLVA